MTWQQILTNVLIVVFSVTNRWASAAKHKQLRQTLNRQLTTHRQLIGVLMRDILSDYGFTPAPPEVPSAPPSVVSRETGPAVPR